MRVLQLHLIYDSTCFLSPANCAQSRTSSKDCLRELNHRRCSNCEGTSCDCTLVQYGRPKQNQADAKVALCILVSLLPMVAFAATHQAVCYGNPASFRHDSYVLGATFPIHNSKRPGAHLRPMAATLRSKSFLPGWKPRLSTARS
jgi:hypothetical protein